MKSGPSELELKVVGLNSKPRFVFFKEVDSRLTI